MRWCVLAGSLVAACGAPCEYYETICDGVLILRCTESDGLADHTFGHLGDACELGETCIDTVDDENLRRAVCSFTGELDRRCLPERPGITHVCADAETVITCNAGYASSRRSCEGACVAPGASAFCSVDTSPSATCAARERCETACSDAGCTSAVLACREGYAIDRIPCASDEECVSLGASYRRAYCASGEPCTGTSTVCVTAGTNGGTRIEGCALGRAVSMACPVGTVCEQYGVLGVDHRPTQETQAECVRR